jgi:hypothetical protein
VERVVVFLDYQNIYMSARRAFLGTEAPSSAGNVKPFALGQLIASRGPAGTDRVLQQVRVYRGLPDANRDPKGNAAVLRQSLAQQLGYDEEAVWEKINEEFSCEPYEVVHQHLRPLQYPPGWPLEPAREKGVDVALAVDFVTGALERRFDIGVIMSTDSDLRSALEAVLDVSEPESSWPFRFPRGLDQDDDDAMDDFFSASEVTHLIERSRVEVAAWRYPNGHSPRLYATLSSGRPVWCHWLDRSDYEAVADHTDYGAD